MLRLEEAYGIQLSRTGADNGTSTPSMKPNRCEEGRNGEEKLSPIGPRRPHVIPLRATPMTKDDPCVVFDTLGSSLLVAAAMTPAVLRGSGRGRWHRSAGDQVARKLGPPEIPGTVHHAPRRDTPLGYCLDRAAFDTGYILARSDRERKGDGCAGAAFPQQAARTEGSSNRPGLELELRRQAPRSALRRRK